MRKSRSFRLCFAVLLISATTYGRPYPPPDGSWKKRVERIVELREAEEKPTKGKLREVTNGRSLLEMLIEGIKSGKAVAYSNWDNTFSTRLTPQQFNEIVVGKTDTEVVEDPVTGKTTRVTRTREFRPEVIAKYRTLEDWSFNPVTGKTEIQIIGIAPISDIYGDDGVFRGVQALFWVKFADVAAIVAKHAEYHPDYSLVSQVWNDYFMSDVKPKAAQKK